MAEIKLNIEFEKEIKDVKKGDKTQKVEVLSPKDNKAYVEAAKNYNEAFTEKLLKELEKFNDEYLKASLELAAEQAKKEFKENSDVERVMVNVPFGVNKTDKATFTIDRERSFPVPGKDEVKRKTYIHAPEISKSGCKISKKLINSLEDDLSEALGIK